MNSSSMLRVATPAMLIAASTAVGQPTVDGTRDAQYGSPVSVQGASVIDVKAGEDLLLTGVFDNSNVGGVAPFGGGAATIFPAPDSDPALVATGVEISISLDEIGWNGTDPIRIAGFLGSSGPDGFVSNQVIGGIGAQQDSLGAAASIDFGAITGDQFVTATTGGTTAATIDGTLDASYGTPLYVNSLASTFGSDTSSDPLTATGSEFNAIYAYADANNLYIFWAGNVVTDFGAKIELFIDSQAGTGQNVLAGNGPGIDFSRLDSYDGLEFDTGFAADYYLNWGNGTTDAFVNVQDMPSAGGGNGGFAGAPKGTVVVLDDVLDNPADQNTDSPNGGTIEAVADYSNTGGVAGVEFEDDFFITDPLTVDTGFEFKIELDRIGYVGGSTINVGGFVAGGGWEFLSNQIIGGLDSGIGNLGAANAGAGIDFNTFNGDQFVSYSVPGSLAASTISIDGSISGDSQYTLIWANNDPAGSGNATQFGDNLNPDPILAGGSEIDAVYAFVGLDPANNNEPTLYVTVAGNLETNNNKLILFFDTDTTPGVGQNALRQDNANIDGNRLNEGLGSDGMSPGLTFDAGFEPDFVISYSGDANLRQASGAQLLAGGGGFGGQFFLTAQGTSAASGDFFDTVSGFGDNDDPSVFFANGSELDNAAAVVDTNFDAPNFERLLHLKIGGNLQPNNNKLEVFIDVDPNAGQNTLNYDDPEDPADDDQANPDVNFNALNRMGGPFQPVDDMGMPTGPVQPGFTFDAGFTADYYYTFSSDNGGTTWFGDFARLNGVNGPMDLGEGRFLGSYAVPTTSGGLSNGNGGNGANEATLFAVNNSNVDGVEGASDQFGATADAVNVDTGIEIGIDLADINWNPSNGDTIKVTVFINGQGHDFVSNQFLGFACVSDLGEPRNVDLSVIDGPQFIEFQYSADGAPLVNVAPAAPDCDAAPLCRGDTNEDGTVDGADLLAVINNFGSTSATRAQGDVAPIPGGDGVVDGGDLLAVINNFGGCTPE